MKDKEIRISKGCVGSEFSESEMYGRRGDRKKAWNIIFVRRNHGNIHLTYILVL